MILSACTRGPEREKKSNPKIGITLRVGLAKFLKGVRNFGIEFKLAGCSTEPALLIQDSIEDQWKQGNHLVLYFISRHLSLGVGWGERNANYKDANISSHRPPELFSFASVSLNHIYLLKSFSPVSPPLSHGAICFSQLKLKQGTGKIPTSPDKSSKVKDDVKDIATLWDPQRDTACLRMFPNSAHFLQVSFVPCFVSIPGVFLIYFSRGLVHWCASGHLGPPSAHQAFYKWKTIFF